MATAPLHGRDHQLPTIGGSRHFTIERAKHRRLAEAAKTCENNEPAANVYHTEDLVMKLRETQPQRVCNRVTPPSSLQEQVTPPEDQESLNSKARIIRFCQHTIFNGSHAIVKNRLAAPNRRHKPSVKETCMPRPPPFEETMHAP